MPGSTGGVERGVEVQMEVEAETEVLELEQLEEVCSVKRDLLVPKETNNSVKRDGGPRARAAGRTSQMSAP